MSMASSPPVPDDRGGSEHHDPPGAAEPVAVRWRLPRGRARPYLILGAVVVVAATVYAVANLWTRGRETTDDAQVDADVVTVSARVGGTVRKVYVTDNAPVRRGDLIVEIDSAALEAKAAQARAELAGARAQAQVADAQVAIVEATSRGGLSAARAQLSGSTTSVASADAQVESARAALAHAQAEAARADTDLTRAESLLKDQAVPRAQVDAARSNAQAARAAVAQAQAQIAAATDMRRTAETHIAEAQGRVDQSAPVDAQRAAARATADLARARVEAAEAVLGQAQLEVSYTRIESPTDGLLSRLGARPGQLLQAGQAIVVVVPHATYVVANFKETQVGRMHPGQRAAIAVDAFPGRSFEGTVDSTSPGTGARFSLLPPDNASGNFVKVVQRVPVRIAWAPPPPDVKLTAGLSAGVTVDTR